MCRENFLTFKHFSGWSGLAWSECLRCLVIVTPDTGDGLLGSWWPLTTALGMIRPGLIVRKDHRSQYQLRNRRNILCNAMSNSIIFKDLFLMCFNPFKTHLSLGWKIYFFLKNFSGAYSLAGKWKSIFVSCIAGMLLSNQNFPESKAHRKHKKRFIFRWIPYDLSFLKD